MLRLGLRATAAGAGHYAAVDLSQEDADQGVLQILETHGWEDFDILILNAGIGHVGPIAETPTSLTQDMIMVNTTGPLRLGHRLLPMVTQRIVFIGSTAYRSANPDFAIYGSTKAALRGAVQSWQVERAGALPLVQMIHPGPTQTDMHDRAGLGDIPIRRLFTPAHIVAGSIANVIDGTKHEKRFGMFYMLRHWVRGLYL